MNFHYQCRFRQCGLEMVYGMRGLEQAGEREAEEDV